MEATKASFHGTGLMGVHVTHHSCQTRLYTVPISCFWTLYYLFLYPALFSLPLVYITNIQ